VAGSVVTPAWYRNVVALDPSAVVFSSRPRRGVTREFRDGILIETPLR